MPRARIGDIDVGYEIRGDAGPWVVMIQGHAYARWGWTWNADALARAHRVVLFDNRGVGETDAPDGPYTVPMLAADVVGLMDHLGIARAHLVGASLGGCIALEVALADPGRVERLVIACASLGGAAAATFPLMPDVVDLMGRVSSMAPEEMLRTFSANALSPRAAQERPDLIDAIVTHRLATAQSPEAWAAQAQAYPAYDASARAASLAADTLILHGRHDRVVDIRNAEVLRETLPGAAFVPMDAGHLLMIEDADRFNALVEAFVDRGHVGLASVA